MTAALDTSLTYLRAWTSGELDAAWALLADDVVLDGPAGRLEGRAAVAGFMGAFASSLTSSALIAAFGDEGVALLMYDAGNPAVASAPGAEHHVVRDGRITAIRIIFDRLPFALARGEVVPAGN